MKSSRDGGLRVTDAGVLRLKKSWQQRIDPQETRPRERDDLFVRLREVAALGERGQRLFEAAKDVDTILLAKYGGRIRPANCSTSSRMSCSSDQAGAPDSAEGRLH